MRLRKKSPTQLKAEEPRRSVTFSLQFGGENDTLRSLFEAWTRARCLGVPDDAAARVLSGYMSRGFSVVFSWTEAMP